jgi:hypothetical protein
MAIPRGLTEPCFILDNSGSMYGPMWDLMIDHISNLAGIIRYPLRVAFIRCDAVETRYGPRLVEDPRSLAELLKSGPSGTSEGLLATTRRVLSSVPTTQSGDRYPLFFMTNASSSDWRDVIEMQGEYGLDFVFFKYTRAGFLDRQIREAVEEAGWHEIRDEVQVDDTSTRPYYFCEGP